jgi:hypothetical protein
MTEAGDGIEIVPDSKWHEIVKMRLDDVRMVSE